MKEALKYHNDCKEKNLRGRYTSPSLIDALIANLPAIFEVDIIGMSVQNRKIQMVKVGSGTTKILLWSQMHGNESTTTKALFDLFNAFNDPQAPIEITSILQHCTLAIVPMLNPDGADQWIRENANSVDLNRDAQALSQPESKLLRTVFDSFCPDVCFNLHGQRTIYGFEATGKPSVLSFLSPAADEGREVTLSRKRAMHIISRINESLQTYLPGQIGRYDDGFNLDCVGDTFQSLEVPTVLYEAGHFPDDYDREHTRKYIFLALVQGLIATVDKELLPEKSYYAIPEHQKCFSDVIVKNTVLEEKKEVVDLHIMFKEILDQGKINFHPYLSMITTGSEQYGHRVIDANFQKISVLGKEKIEVGIDVKHILIGENDTITL